MSNSKITRYEPATVEVETGIGCYDEVDMKESAKGSYIERAELLASLNQMLEDACDPGEKDVINKMLDLLK